MFLLEQNKSTHLDFLQPCSTLGLRSQPLACKSCLISAEFAQSGKPRSCKQRLLPCKLLLAASGSAVGGAERSSLCCSVRPCSGALCCLLRPVVTCRHRNWGGVVPVPAFCGMPPCLPCDLAISCAQLGAPAASELIRCSVEGLKNNLLFVFCNPEQRGKLCFLRFFLKSIQGVIPW